MSESLVFLDAKHKPSSRKRFGIATVSLCGVMLTAGCNAEDEPIAGPTVTATVVEQAGFQIKRDTDIHVLRLKASTDRPHDVNDTRINSVIHDAGRYMSYDFEGNIGDIKTASISDVTQTPRSTETQTGEPCYSFNEVLSIRNTETAKTVAVDKKGVNNVTLMAVDDVMLCAEPAGKTQENSKAAAFAVGDFMFFSEQKDGTSYFRPDNFLHEYGHIAGLPHEGAVTCKRDEQASIYDPTDNALQDIKEIVSEKAGCHIERNQDGSIYAYAGANTIMADGGLDQSDIDTGIVPAFSTLDKHIVLPDVYKITEIDTKPKTIGLKYRDGLVNGVAISLPENHPLKSIDSSLTRLTVTVEVIGGGVNADEKYLKKRSCGEDGQCALKLYVSNDDYSKRIDLPEPTDNFRSVGTESSQVLYLDEKLNIALLQHMDIQADELYLEVIEYEKGLRFSQQQIDKRTKLYKSYEEEETRTKK